MVTNSLLREENDDSNKSSTKITNKPTSSGASGQTISEVQTDKNIEIIDKFIGYCNNKNHENAYNMLTNGCKEEYSNSIDDFKDKYINTIFKSSKSYKLELWMMYAEIYTYKINYYNNNLLATGGKSLSSGIDGYITVTSDGYISVGNFIRKQNINKSNTSQNIEILVNDKRFYKDYEIYNVTIRNRTDKTIMLAEGNYGREICVVDEKGVEYPSYIDEIEKESLSIKPGYERNINIKFSKIYDIYRIINSLKFKDIILDKEQYDKNSSSDNKLEIEVKF